MKRHRQAPVLGLWNFRRNRCGSSAFVGHKLLPRLTSLSSVPSICASASDIGIYWLMRDPATADPEKQGESKPAGTQIKNNKSHV